MTAHKRCQYKNIKKHWHTLQILRKSKRTFIKTVVIFFYSLSFELCKYCLYRQYLQIKLVRIYLHQKHVARIINFMDKFTDVQPILHDMKALNIFQINLFHTCFTYLLSTIRAIFHSLFKPKSENEYNI